MQWAKGNCVEDRCGGACLLSADGEIHRFTGGSVVMLGPCLSGRHHGYEVVIWHTDSLKLVCMHGIAWRKLLVRQAWAVLLACGSYGLVLDSIDEADLGMGCHRECRTPLA